MFEPLLHHRTSRQWSVVARTLLGRTTNRPHRSAIDNRQDWALDVHQGAFVRFEHHGASTSFQRTPMPQNPTERKTSRQLNRIRTSRARPVHATDIASPEQPVAVIILPVTVPLSPSSEGLRRVAAGLQDRGFATFLAELLSPEEIEHGYHSFDFEMLADRISEVTKRLRREPPFADLPIGYFGTSTDAAALVLAAAQPDCPAGALVMCDARPELASAALPRVHAPTLFIVDDEEPALDLNRSALAKLVCRGELTILRGSGKGLVSAEIAYQAARLAGNWFETHLAIASAG